MAAPDRADSSPGAGSWTTPAPNGRPETRAGAGSLRQRALVVTVILVVAVLLIAALYVETLPSPPTTVSANSIIVLTNFTDLPKGQTPPNAFEVFYAWFNATGERSDPAVLQAPAGSVAPLHLTLQFNLASGAYNCSVNGISVQSPFAIASLEGNFDSPVWTSQPFPLNWSGATLTLDPVASLVLNVTLPNQAGVYVPTFVMDAVCGNYG